MARGRASPYGDGVGRRELLLVFLVGCTSDFVDPEEGRYALADAPDAKIDRGFPEPVPDATPEVAAETGPDAEPERRDAGVCVRDEARDGECAGYDGPDAAPRYAIRCPADDAGNPALPPPAIGCHYTGWADAGTLTMCCK